MCWFWGCSQTKVEKTVSKNNRTNSIITRLLALGVRPLNYLDSQIQYVTFGEWLGAADKFFNKIKISALIHLVHPVDPV
jgi:hypothetical protein